MQKPFLLIAGTHYYPNHGTGDWRGLFETKEQAEAHKDALVKKEDSFRLNLDWYVIVDLRTWDPADNDLVGIDWNVVNINQD